MMNQVKTSQRQERRMMDGLRRATAAGRARGEGNVRTWLWVLAFLLTCSTAETLHAASIGMVANHGSSSVTVFDTSTDTVLGSVAITPSEVLDCSLDEQRNLGYAGDFAGHIWAIDTGASPPVLASGTNPIDASLSPEDTAITRDRRFLLSCDGGLNQPVSVIDLATRTEVSTLALSGGCQGVEACADGSVLVVQAFNDVLRLTIDASGTLTDTGEVLSVSAFNVVCGRGGKTGVAINNGSIQSFTIPGLTPVDTRALSGFGGISAVVNGGGDRLYVRGGVAVDVFTFDSATGAIGALPLVTIPVAFTGTYFGVDQLALNDAETKLYVSEVNAINVYSATSGAFVDSITDPSILEPTGICTVASVCGDGVVGGAEACDDGNQTSGDGCDTNCTFTACGNGVVTAGEECDDGNANNDDCCSNSCASAPDETPCNDQLFCNGTDTCSVGACSNHTGSPCTGGAECNDHCNEATDNCVVAAGISCTADGNVCTLDQCDGAGQCTHPNQDFVACDDGVFCNGVDLCLAGSCTFHQGDPCTFNECADRCDELSAVCIATTQGTACFDDGNTCTNDECNGLGSCEHPPRPSGVACTSDGNACTLDQCNGSGACAHPAVANGVPCASDGNACTTDQCNGAGTCAHPPVPDGTACNDTNACTQTDQCHSGQCTGANPIVCPAPLCHLPGTCDPSTGTCSSCPLGYSQGNGGCQKIYPIDGNHLDNLDAICAGADRYNNCFGDFGFHWTDTGDASVGPVTRVDVQLRQGVDCDVSSHAVALNATSIGSYPPTDECTCSPLVVPRVLPNVDTSTYVKGGNNSVVVSADDCSGLSRDAQGRYAFVTVTYQDAGLPLGFRDDCRSASKSKLKYKKDTDDGKDLLNWKWSNGVATTQGEFADPTDMTDYQLCVFAESSDNPTLLIGADVPASATLWDKIGSKGYKYKDRNASHAGISKIVAKGGPDGKSKILVKGKGAELSDPSLPLSPGTSGIRVQLTNPSTGICWASEFPFGTAIVDDHSIKAKVP